MKNTTLVLGAFAATFAAASIYLGVELGGARERLAEQELARGADRTRIAQLEAGQLRLQAALADAETVIPVAPPTGAPPSMARQQQLEGAAMPAGVVPGPRTERRGSGDDSPAARNARRLQQEVRLRRRYTDMPETLGLDASQADKLFDLLADQQLAESIDARGYEGDRLGRQAIEAAARQKRDAEIEALLGPDKAAEFQAFEQSIPARMQVSRIGESMAAANVPLTETQRKSLITAVATELKAGPPPERFTDGKPNADYEARFLDWQADYSRRVQTRVEPLLNAEQARNYREAVEMQNARRADRRNRTGTGRTGPTPQ